MIIILRATASMLCLLSLIASKTSTKPQLGTRAKMDPDNAIYGFDSGGIASYVVPRQEPNVDIVDALDVIPEIQLVEAEAKRKQLHRIGGIVIIVSIVVLVIATVGVSLQERENRSMAFNAPPSIETISTHIPTQEPSFMPANTEISTFLSIIKSFYKNKTTDSFHAAYSNPSTPQYRAALWVTTTVSTSGIALEDRRNINRFALATFYFATNGDEWVLCGRGSTQCDESQEWLQGAHECDWYAVRCTDDGASVTEIFFAPNGESSNNMRGTLPYELSFLSDLEVFILSRGPISGPFPDWSAMSSLQQVLLNSNDITGSFPDYLLSKNSQLKTLQFRDNNLQGELTLSLDASLLTDLSLRGNRLSGTLPSQLQLLDALKTLDLGNNRFKGAVPTELIALANLTVLDLKGNTDLFGNIPTMIGSLSNLFRLDLSNTGIGGTLPPELFSLSNLRVLDLGFANFSGPLPESISNLTNLDTAILHHNAFTGTVPSGLDALLFLETLELHENDLEGSVSQALCNRRGDGFGDIQSLTVDCDRVACTCCTNCLP